VAELRQMKTFYADLVQHQRLLQIVEEHLGHALIGQAETAKIAVAEADSGEAIAIDLSLIEPGLSSSVDEATAVKSLDADLQRIVDAADTTLAQAGL
jgi:hypothetical chaperone protein